MDYILAEKKINNIILKNFNVLTDVVEFLYENFNHYSWIGIYIVEGNDLILGPWKGKQATEHTKIPIGKGICGSAAASGKTEIISDVHSDERYLA
ncbi:hypothetical protein AYK21_05090 [Thermoplasmatales archaeon SG8-52-2]|nr:MAG: hypothetical protein AYK21_05090 [Thermoplasmatales archaeon SG8-52-2]